MKKITFYILPFIILLIVLGIHYSELNLSYFEVIVTAIIVCIASFIEFGKKGFKALGLSSSTKGLGSVLLQGTLIAVALFIVYIYVLIPLVTSLTGSPMDFESFREIKGNTPMFLIGIIYVWISAGLCEELVWRGYFMKQGVKIFGDGKLAILFNIIILGVIFGMLHSYQGISGIIITGIIGSIIAFLFYKKNYNLWFTVVVHGMFDSIALIVLYFGILEI